MKLIFVTLLTLWTLLLGCASTTPQSELALNGAYDVPTSHIITGVPFVEQTSGQCGPATLTMALRWLGKDISVDQISSEIYTPSVKGSFQTDMISAARRQGLIAIPIKGLSALFQEINADHPVIVFENLSVSWLPQWHYAFVFGYDLQTQKILMHSGPEAFKYWDLRKFERSWSLGDYWGLVVLKPDQLAASANESAHVIAASALEQIGKTEAATRAYQQTLIKWPKSFVARIGLANIFYSNKEFAKAVKFLEQASSTNPNSPVVWHNLVLAQAAAGKLAQARKSAIEAIKRASPEDRDEYKNNLKEWLR
ncbi:MAG: PA2778 family cysteine peptidase [Pseudobdellovibrionaceae bacterium]